MGLINHIRQYIQISDKEADLICEHTSYKSLKNKEYLLEENQICRNHYFVEEGCLRMFFINQKGVEQTTHFAIENWWITDYSSFDNKVPTQYYIQAIGRTKTLAIDQERFIFLLDSIPALERYFRIIMQRAVAASQERIRLLYSLSKEELYLHFNTYFPDFAQRVPQYMLASFLGLTPEYVSEIRKKRS